MKTLKKTTVRVTAVRKMIVTEYVDVVIAHPEDDLASEPTRKAKDLIEAMTDAGQDIDWHKVSEVPTETYSNRVTAEIYDQDVAAMKAQGPND